MRIYYLHLSPGKNFLACGFWAPNPADLKRIRQEIDIDGDDYRAILNDKSFRSVWGELEGEAVRKMERLQTCFCLFKFLLHPQLKRILC